MKKILQIGLTANYGGIESFVLNLYNKIDRNEFQFDFLNIESENKNLAYTNDIKKLGGSIISIPSRSEDLKKHKSELKKIIEEGKYDVVHNHLQTWSYSEGIKIPLKSNKNIKVIVHSHNSYYNDNRIITKIMNFKNKFLNENKSINRLACSYSAGQWMFRKKKYEIINNGVDTSLFSFDNNIREDYRQKFNLSNKKVFLSVGRLTNQKNYNYLINIFSDLIKLDENFVLFIVGEGELKKQLLSKVYDKNLQNNVFFLGRRNDVNNLMCMSDSFILTSFFEGLPLVSVEAQSSGLPVYLSNTISEESNITNLCKYIDINYESKRNAEFIFENFKFCSNREHFSNLVKKSSFDVNYTVNRISDIYSQK